MNRLFLIFGLLMLSSVVPAFASDQGIERVVLDDGLPRHCINAKEDRVSISLDRLVVNKSKNWIKEDSAVDIIVDGRMQKRGEDEQITSAESPVVFRANIAEYTKGTLVIPSTIRFISRFKLGRTDHVTDLIELDFSFVKRSDSTLLSKVLSSLPDAADGLPLPPTPYTEVFRQATQTIGNIMETLLADGENSDDVSREGRISMEFNTTGQCGRNGTFAGSYLYIKFSDANSNKKGVLDISNIGKYCYFSTKGVSTVYFSKKDGSGVCSYEGESSSRLSNPHFVIRIAIANQIDSKRETVESPMSLEFANTKINIPIKFDEFTKSVIDRRLGIDAFSNAYDSVSFGAFAVDNENLRYEVSEALAPQISPTETWYETNSNFVVNPGSNSAILTALARCADRGIEVSACF